MTILLTAVLYAFGALVTSVTLRRAGERDVVRTAAMILWPCWLLVVIGALPLALLEHFLETR